jgi:hypothetical protein
MVPPSFSAGTKLMPSRVWPLTASPVFSTKQVRPSRVFVVTKEELSAL